MTELKQDRTHKWDAEFAAFKLEHPEATFAQYYASAAMKKISAGKAHSTLGGKLYDRSADGEGEKDFWEAGRKAFERYKRFFGLESSSKVVDYGCGSLRLGGHFIRFLEPDHYFGLDVTSDFFEIGKTLVGEDLLREKRPQLAPIGEDSVTRGAAFGADFVFSNAVSYHVHPDETAMYFGNLVKLMGKPGAGLFFDVKITEEPVRFRERGWAWPMEFYLKALQPLNFVKLHGSKVERQNDASNGELLKLGVLEFRRG